MSAWWLLLLAPAYIAGFATAILLVRWADAEENKNIIYQQRFIVTPPTTEATHAD